MESRGPLANCCQQHVGGRHRYSNRWLGREPRRRRPRARGAGYKAGRGGRAGWSCARGRRPCGARPAPGPRCSSPRRGPPRLAPRGAGCRAQSRRPRSAAGARGLGARAAAAGASAPLSPPASREVCGRKLDGPARCVSGAQKGPAEVMAPTPPAATAPGGRWARSTPPPPPAWAPRTGAAAGNQGRPGRVRALVGCRRRERSCGGGRREGGRRGPRRHRRARGQVAGRSPGAREPGAVQGVRVGVGSGARPRVRDPCLGTRSSASGSGSGRGGAVPRLRPSLVGVWGGHRSVVAAPTGRPAETPLRPPLGLSSVFPRVPSLSGHFRPYGGSVQVGWMRRRGGGRGSSGEGEEGPGGIFLPDHFEALFTLLTQVRERAVCHGGVPVRAHWMGRRGGEQARRVLCAAPRPEPPRSGPCPSPQTDPVHLPAPPPGEAAVGAPEKLVAPSCVKEGLPFCLPPVTTCVVLKRLLQGVAEASLQAVGDPKSGLKPQQNWLLDPETLSRLFLSSVL